MTIEEFVRLIFSFLRGGLVAGLLDWWRTSLSEARTRRIEVLRLQLQEFYGPLQFFCLQNTKLLQAGENINTANMLEYLENENSTDSQTRLSSREKSSKALELKNQYIEQIDKNNNRILATLEKNFALIEPNDTDLFAQFIIDYVRMRTEVDDKGNIKTPQEIFKRLGAIPFIRLEFTEIINKRFMEKKVELNKLLK